MFIAFAIENKNLRDLMVGQSLHTDTPFEFTDMSVKEPWDSKWKTRCRERIRSCDGVIGIITPDTVDADGQIWELECAYDENVPVKLIYGTKERDYELPEVVEGRRINVWSWDNIADFIDSL